ncbi:DUF418 domain-containing protein [Paenibacillus sp. ACRRX]|uniref:DUF418 domain-containing protein n=1 Tax=Paenibacillus sp. ACRRX TaxID=2918206 RepID=UPI001EF476CB|nr:DUF418 domain-containing protein [Paenibacillus sp. ACRRX]MCG7409767.1 DUF418 domain-containing protein [Paenibacillus sp. ACRRX]
MSQLVQPSQRIDALDIIRGFAIFGIFFVNVPDMIGNGVNFATSYTGADAMVRLLYDMFIQTKFYTIFSFLFGLGFYLFMQSAARRALPVYRLFTRRLLLLLLIGIAHYVLLWQGDILHAYGLFGFLLLLFYKRSAKTILTWSITLLSLYALLIVLLGLAASYTDASGDTIGLFPHVPDMRMRINHLFSNGFENLSLLVFEVLGLFLLGLYAGKKRWFERLHLYQGAIKRLQWISAGFTLLLFIPMVVYYASHPIYNTLQNYGYTHLTGKTLAVFYVCTLLRLIHRFGSYRFQSLAAVGRMALTNYLTQTLLTMGLLRLLWNDAGTAPLWMGTIYVVIILIIQTFCSKLWLRFYQMGPVEWIWRAGTYGQFSPLRHKSNANQEPKRGR